MSNILIFSKNIEPSTDSVIDWILKEGGSFIRLNGETLLYENGFLSLEEEVSSKIRAIWFRRTYDLKELNLPTDLARHLQKECSALYYYNYFNIVREKTVFQLNKYDDIVINKLLVNKMASNLGLRTPKSYVVNNKKRLVELFVEFGGGIIFKAFSQIFRYYVDNTVYVSYTEKVSEEGLEKIPNYFLPSYIQEYIKSDFEIRVVFLMGNFYSMAIFNSRNANTKTDYRNYDFENWNRMIPFVLPQKIKMKITKLVNQMDLNFCSIDLMYSGGEYFFLEVNPVGQFGMVSLPCNFNIEKRISEILIYEAKNNS